MSILACIVRRRRWVLALFFALAAAAAPGLLRLGVDNSARRFFVDDHRTLAGYDRFRALFGRDDTVRIAVRGPGVWTAAGLAWLRHLEEEVPRVPGVLGAAGLWGHHRWRLAGWPPPDPQAFRAEVLADPLDRNAGWVSADGELVSLFAVLYDLPPPRRRGRLARLDALLAAAPPGVEAWVSGLPVLDRAFSREVRAVGGRFFPLLVALAVVLLAAVFRDARDVARPLLLVALCQTALFGAMGWAGAALDLVVVLLVPLVFVVAVATAIHVSVRFRDHRQRGLDAPAATLATYRDKGWPVLWAGVTTAAGFASLAVSETPPVRALGLWAAAGIAFLTLAAFTFYPAVLAAGAAGGECAADPSPTRFEAWARRRGRAWAGWAARRRRAVIAVFALAAALALAGLPRLTAGAPVLEFLRPADPVRAGFATLERHGVGAVAAELVVARAGSFESAYALDRLARLEAALRADPLVLGVVGPPDLVTAAAGWALPADAARDSSADADGAGTCFVLTLLRAMPETAPLLRAVLTGDGRAARLTLFVPMADYPRLEPLFARAEAAARAAFPAADVWVTGQLPLVLAAQRVLLRTMVLSLSLTLLVVAGVFALLLRGPRPALAALAPNLWPVALVVGAMGWLRVPLDSTTVLIAAVVLGLAVDDTLHQVGSFRRRMGAAAGADPGEAAAGALEETAAGHLLTTMVLAAGFAVCALSSFVPVARFGALTAAALVFALIADLVLLPALLAGLPAGPRAATTNGGPATPKGGGGASV